MIESIELIESYPHKTCQYQLPCGERCDQPILPGTDRSLPAIRTSHRCGNERPGESPQGFVVLYPACEG